MAAEVVAASAMREKRPACSERPCAMTSGLPYHEESGPRGRLSDGPRGLPPPDEMGASTGTGPHVLGERTAAGRHGASVGVRGESVGVGPTGSRAWNGEICHGWHTLTRRRGLRGLCSEAANGLERPRGETGWSWTKCWRARSSLSTRCLNPAASRARPRGGSRPLIVRHHPPGELSECCVGGASHNTYKLVAELRYARCSLSAAAQCLLLLWTLGGLGRRWPLGRCGSAIVVALTCCRAVGRSKHRRPSEPPYVKRYCRWGVLG